MFAGQRRRRHQAGALGRAHQVLGPLLEHRLLVGLDRLPTPQRRRVLPALGRQQHVDHRADEHERRGEHVDPDAGDVGGGVVAHQLDPEAAHAIGRHIQREQPAVAQPELAVGPQQEKEHQQVPQQFVEEGRVHHRGDLTGRHPVQGVHVDHPGGVPAVEHLHAPRHRRLATVEFLVEVVAQPADRLRQDNARRHRVAEGGQRNSPAATRNPRPDTAQEDRAPDAQAAFPDPRRRADAGPAGAEVGLPVGRQVIQPATDQPERHRPHRHVVDDPAFAAAGHPAAVADDQRGDDAGDDAQRVGPDRDRPEVPDALPRTGEIGKHRCRHVAGTFSRTPTASSPVSVRTAGTPSSVSAETRAEPTITPSA